MTQETFRMTFGNSWRESIVALLAGWLVVRTLVIAVLVFSPIEIADRDIEGMGAIAALAFAVWFAHYLSRARWERQKKLKAQAISSQ